MLIPDCYDPVSQAEAREAEADRGAVRCDACGHLIRRGKKMFTLSVGKTDLYICEDCKGEMVASVQIVGFPEMEVIA